jgi:multiple sugar transport system permease protein
MLRKSTRNKLIWVLLLVITVVSISPLVWMLLASVKTTAQMFASPPVIIPPKPTWENYKGVLLGAGSRLPFVKNSILISIATTVVVMALAGAGGFWFRKNENQGE